MADRRARPVDEPPPLWRQSITRWSKDDQEEWAERAAIMEYLAADENPHREAAEKAAWNLIIGARMEGKVSQ